jgi:hypothetical protein
MQARTLVQQLMRQARPRPHQNGVGPRQVRQNLIGSIARGSAHLAQRFERANTGASDGTAKKPAGQIDEQMKAFGVHV